GSAPAARAVLWLQTREASRADALSCRLRAAGLGQRDAIHAARVGARARVRRRARRDPVAQPAPSGVSGLGGAARSAARQLDNRSSHPTPRRGRLDGGTAQAGPDPGFDGAGTMTMLNLIVRIRASAGR